MIVFCCTLVLAAKGYPGEYKRDFYIDHSSIVENDKIKIFHAGTVYNNNILKSVGGRILTVNVFSDTKDEAISIAYENIGKIKIFEDESMSIQNQDLVFIGKILAANYLFIESKNSEFVFVD